MSIFALSILSAVLVVLSSFNQSKFIAGKASDAEKGERNVSIEVVERLARALNVKIKDLFDE